MRIHSIYVSWTAVLKNEHTGETYNSNRTKHLRHFPGWLAKRVIAWCIRESSR